MAELNHTIVWCSDQRSSADFLTSILGLPEARRFLHFLVVDLQNGVSLDYYQKEGKVAPQHYAFLSATPSSMRRSSGSGSAVLSTGPIPPAQTPARSIITSAAAASISPIPTSICSS